MTLQENILYQARQQHRFIHIPISARIIILSQIALVVLFALVFAYPLKHPEVYETSDSLINYVTGSVFVIYLLLLILMQYPFRKLLSDIVRNNRQADNEVRQLGKDYTVYLITWRKMTLVRCRHEASLFDHLWRTFVTNLWVLCLIVTAMVFHWFAYIDMHRPTTETEMAAQDNNEMVVDVEEPRIGDQPTPNIKIKETPSAQKPKLKLVTINLDAVVDLGLSVKWHSCNIGADKPFDLGGMYTWDEARAAGRLPTMTEQKELMEKCQWEEYTIDGTTGYVVTGPNGNSIFLPFAGKMKNGEKILIGERGCYWSFVTDRLHEQQAMHWMLCSDRKRHVFISLDERISVRCVE